MRPKLCSARLLVESAPRTVPVKSIAHEKNTDNNEERLMVHDRTPVHLCIPVRYKLDMANTDRWTGTVGLVL
ncbi:hypothetical protein TNCV_3964481 [Trichonephila clavipes]|nr:hypothetical protein TNCV_3964481 [Trichonephila clavipes]